MIELLAITDDATPPEPPLGAVRCGDLSVVWAPAGEGEVDAEALWERESLLERLMEDRDLLPVRFGTRVEDEQAAAEAIAPHSDALARALQRVRGAIEVSVRVMAEAQPAGEPGGREYLRDRVAREQVARELHAALGAGARDAVILGGSELLKAAYLVPRAEVDVFVARFRALQRERPELAMVCTGPWPPYSFTEAT